MVGRLNPPDKVLISVMMLMGEKCVHIRDADSDNKMTTFKNTILL